MPNRSSKRPKHPDVNQIAKSIVEEATDDVVDSEEESTAASGKNPAAVALGRLGGIKGGAARAAALSKEERTAIAKKAAKVRWAKHHGDKK